MTDRLRLGPGVLEGMIANLARCRHDLTAAETSSDAVAGAVGHAGLAGVLGTFADNWRITRSRLLSELDSVEGALSALDTGVGQVDGEIASQLSGPERAGSSDTSGLGVAAGAGGAVAGGAVAGGAVAGGAVVGGAVVGGAAAASGRSRTDSGAAVASSTGSGAAAAAAAVGGSVGGSGPVAGAPAGGPAPGSPSALGAPGAEAPSSGAEPTGGGTPVLDDGGLEQGGLGDPAAGGATGPVGDLPQPTPGADAAGLSPTLSAPAAGAGLLARSRDDTGDLIDPGAPAGLDPTPSDVMPAAGGDPGGDVGADDVVAAGGAVAAGSMLAAGGRAVPGMMGAGGGASGGAGQASESDRVKEANRVLQKFREQRERETR